MIIECWKVPGRAGYRYRKFSARVHVAKYYIGHSAATLLAKIPAFENCRYVFTHVIESNRPPVKNDCNHGLARTKHSLYKIILSTDQFESRGIAHVVECPRF